MEIHNNSRLDEANAAFLQGDFSTARNLFEVLVATGSKSALLGLAAIYERGNSDVPQDFTKAKYWFERALASANSAKAALKLGNYYYLGFGVPVDYAKALSYYLRLKDNKDPIALYRLGVHYEKGQGTQQDIERAVDYYRRAARLGNIQARKQWGVLEVKNRNFLLGLFLWGWAIIQGVPLAFTRTNDKRLRVF